MTNQPKWRCVANLGDVNPVDHGGLFVFVDETGVYAPEMVLVEPPNPYDYDDGELSANAKWLTYRVVLEPCTYVDGVLSDNPYHPSHCAWFATPESERINRPQDTTYLSNVGASCDRFPFAIIEDLTSNDPIARANAWRAILDYHGWKNGDSYPNEYNRAEIEERCNRYLSQIEKL